mmetsp:Transcript_96935/g.134633  ORF Transcript_96935/g.134633 Transcript_96935/m.134633 type:complete len:195 (-) Transcript_96935:37-621(-)
MSGANAFSLSGMQYVKGEPVDLAKEKGKSVIVVEMWATWCPPCKTSIPHLTELQHKYPDAKFIGITNEPPQTAQPFVNGMGDKMDYRVACDPTGSVSGKYMQHWNLQGIPSAIVVNKAGKMIWGGHPMDGGFESALRKAYAEKSEPTVDLSKETVESLMKMSVKQLKVIARENNVSLAGCFEKREIVENLKGKA